METVAPAVTVRSIDAILPAPAPHWVGDGFYVHGYFSHGPALVRALSPFLLLDYHAPYVYPPTDNLRRGVGPHPHRGFETVTVALEGSVAHHDSTGAGGVIGPGDVQWMTAGGGILHKEYHEAAFARAGGRMHMLQIWVNLPAAHKMTAPGYQLLEAGAIGSAQLANGGGAVRVIAGDYGGVRGAARTFTPVGMLEARLNAGGRMPLHADPSHTVAILVMDGDVAINGERSAQRGDFVVFGRDGADVVVESRSAGAHLMVLSGEPIAEPIVQYGPFAMNTQDEIRAAIVDFNAGRFGVLAE